MALRLSTLGLMLSLFTPESRLTCTMARGQYLMAFESNRVEEGSARKHHFIQRYQQNGRLKKF